MSKFIVPDQGDGYGDRKNNPSIGSLDAYQMRGYPPKGYSTRKLRYRKLDDDRLLVETWLENNVKSKGVLGRAVSMLAARYHMQKTDDGYWRLVGKAESWYWGGERRSIREYVLGDGSDGSGAMAIYNVNFDNQGRLTEYYDNRRGPSDGRGANFEFDSDGNRSVTYWRGRYCEKKNGGGYDRQTVVLTRHPDGLPLNLEGDYVVRVYLRGTSVLLLNETYSGGKQHGFRREYNKFGRVIEEKYFHKGVEVPDWVYLDPKQVTPEEIQAEESAELREVMLELQGPEVYQVRAMARSMKAISRARLIETEVVVEAGPIAVRRSQ